jgi:hypothetical protein
LLGLFNRKADDTISAEQFEVSFDLPAYRQQESKLPDVSKVWLQLDSLSGEATHLLVELNHFLHELNRTIVGIGKRYTITERCLEYAAPAVRSVYFEHQKGKALPENHFKREAVSAAIKCVRELSFSYKRIVKNDCNLTGKEQKTARRRLAQSLFSALEMIHAEQRLKALRYQKLGNLTWRDCNSLYVILRKAGDPYQNFKPSFYLSIARTAAGESGLKSFKTTAEDIYILVQLFGFADSTAMSLQQTVIVENYLKLVLPDLRVEDFNEDKLPLQYVVTSSGRETPPIYNEGIAGNDDTLVIDIKPLASRLKQDYVRLLPQLSGAQNDFEHVQPRCDVVNAKVVNNLEDIERLLTLQNMLKKIREIQRADTRKYSDKAQRLYIYNGFTAGFRVLNANNQQLADQNRLQNQLNISLAERSASLADSDQESTLTHWEIVNESAGGLLLRTKETQYIKSLFVGQLIVFGRSKDDLSNPACGWIVRICRDNQANVEISLKILAHQIESVVVQTEFLRKNAMGMPGIMILDSGESLQLLMHQSHRLLPGSQVYICRNGNSYCYVVGDMPFFHREFVVYWLQ